jgi:hypothetical protein
MDVARFLSALYSELDRSDQEIRFLERCYARPEARWMLGPELSVLELERFRGRNATVRRGSDRMFSLQ